MEFLLGAAVFMIGVLVGATISRMNTHQTDDKDTDKTNPKDK